MDKTFHIDLTKSDEEIDAQLEAMFAELDELGFFDCDEEER